jgi:O-antigen/teichoic acid export membrane protein
VFNISLVIHLVLAFMVLFFAETAGVFYINNYLNVEPGKIPDALFVMRFSALATSFSVASIPYQGVVTAQEKFGARATIEIIRSVLAFLAALVIIFSDDKLRLYAILIAIANGAPSLLFFLYCKKKYKEITQW